MTGTTFLASARSGSWWMGQRLKIAPSFSCAMLLRTFRARSRYASFALLTLTSFLQPLFILRGQLSLKPNVVSPIKTILPF